MKARHFAAALAIAAASPAAAGPVVYRFICDLNGMQAEMLMQVEIVGTAGVVTGPGPYPSITGVIGTGEHTIFTAGEVRSAAARYVFTGENQFADFTDMATMERFRVRWVEQPGGLLMIVNPFADPAWQGRHFCHAVPPG